MAADHSKLSKRERKHAYKAATVLGGLFIGLPVAGFIVGAFWSTGGFLGLLIGLGVAIVLLSALWAILPSSDPYHHHYRPPD